MAVAFAAASILFYFAALMCTHLAGVPYGPQYAAGGGGPHRGPAPGLLFRQSDRPPAQGSIDDQRGHDRDPAGPRVADLVGAIVTAVAAVVLLFVFDWRMGLLCLVPMAVSVWLLTG